MSAATVSDVAILGGGVMGSAAAAFLAMRGASVVVVEEDSTYATASSALSASSIRQQFSTPVCLEMSRFGFDFLRDLDAHLGLHDAPADAGLVERGYLYLADAPRAGGLEAAVEVQRRLGAPVSRLAPADLSARFPWLNLDDLELGAYGEAGEGWFDGYSLLQAFRRKARTLGVTFVSARGEGFARTAGRVEGVLTRDGLHAAAVTVNAAGFRAGEAAAWAGVDLPVAPERRCIYVFDCPGAPRDLPLIVDPAGVYVRPEGALFLAGGPATAHPHAAPPCFDVDAFQFEEAIWPILAHRVPAFETLRLVRGWAGQYDMNRFDHNAVVGWAPGAPGLVLMAGFSGHGLQHAPAAGRGVAELILDGGYRTLDLSALDPGRIARGEPLRELNVI